jgi:predicted nucleotidyltransferase
MEKTFDHNELRTLMTPQDYEFIVPKGTILLGWRGSMSHGTYVPDDHPLSTDDKDLLGVCIPDIRNYLGLSNFEQKEAMVGPWDSVVYEMRKFMRLLSKCNPNVISLLWLKPEHYFIMDPLGEKLVYNKELFLSKEIYHTFTGYAYGQLKRMTHFAFNGYMGDKRKKLVEKFGYDTKNASHLIRLLRMGIETLREGKVNVWREDAEELISIKQGKFTLEQIQDMANDLFEDAKVAFEKSGLPKEVDKAFVEKLLIAIIRDYFGIPRTSRTVVM